MSESFKVLAKELGEIQAYLEARKAIVEKLGEEAKDVEALLQMSKEEVDAIVRKFGKQLRKTTKKDVALMVTGALASALLGILGTLLFIG